MLLLHAFVSQSIAFYSPARVSALMVRMLEQHCHHMQGKAAQTKSGPAPRAVAPAKGNAKLGVKQSTAHTTRTLTSTGAVQVGLDQIRHGLTACLPGFTEPAVHCLGPLS